MFIDNLLGYIMQPVFLCVSVWIPEIDWVDMKILVTIRCLLVGCWWLFTNVGLRDATILLFLAAAGMLHGQGV